MRLAQHLGGQGKFQSTVRVRCHLKMKKAGDVAQYKSLIQTPSAGKAGTFYSKPQRTHLFKLRSTQAFLFILPFSLSCSPSLATT